MSDDEQPSDDKDRFEDEGSEGERRRLIERALPEVLRNMIENAVDRGVGAIAEGAENFRRASGEMKVPKEAAGYLYSQIDDTKKGVYRVVAKEIRDVLEHTNFSDEIAKVLTKLSFEVNTTVRFVPNTLKDSDASNSEENEDRDGKSQPKRSKLPRPRVVSKVVMKAVDSIERATKGSES
jgi:hypothetical protein